MKSIITFCFVLIISNVLHGQEMTHWYFGNNAIGLHFNPEPAVLSDGYTPYGWAGCSVLNHPIDGHLILASDGKVVLDKNLDPVMNGTGLNGGNSTHSSGKICIRPGTCSQFYVFSINTATESSSIGDLFYSIVDTSLVGFGTLPNPLGEVVVGQKNILIASDVTESLEIVVEPATHNYWLITTKYEEPVIRVFHITESGIVLIDSYNYGIDMADQQAIRYSKANGKLAMGSFRENDPVVLVDFDAVTGEFSNPMEVPGTPVGTSSNPYSGIIDLEWSPSGTKLYISKYRGNTPSSGGQLHQYNLDTPAEDVELIHYVSSNNTHVAKGLRLGPDGKVYWMAVDPQTNTAHDFACISEPDAAGLNCNLQLNYLEAEINMTQTGLFPDFLKYPNSIAPAQIIPIALTVPCSNNAGGSVLLGQYLSDAEGDSLLIDTVFADVGEAYVEDGELFYSLPAGFEGICTIQVNYCDDYCFPLCSQLVFVLDIESSQTTANPLEDEVVNCAFDQVTLGYEAEGFSYLWSTGDTTAYITITAPGQYIYNATNADGCVIMDTVNVLLEMQPTDLITFSDTLACVGESLLISAYTSAENIVWSTDETTSSINVSQSGQYWVMTYDFEGCEAMDTVDVNFAPLPAAAITVNATTCSTKLLYSGSDGTLLWSNGVDSPSIALTESGEYWVMVVDEQGCSDSAFTYVQLLPPPEVVIVQSNTPCQTVLTASGAEGDIYWSTGANTNSIVITQSGPYSVEITLDDGCSFSASVEAVVQLLDTLVIHEDISLCRHLLYADENNATLEWSNGSTVDSLEVYSSGAYTLTQTYANDCVVTSTIYADVALPQLPLHILPNVFTPNADGLNDVFQTFPDALTCASEFEMTVFNRWGNELYHTKDKGFQWAATSGTGGFVADGVYFCTVKFVHQTLEHSFDWHVQVLR
ncbi:MAG: gliding motility-associated C-terminal domain-containing protein [Flavobacteriales bacterium]